jgi:UDP-N-acetylmuramoyl-L-alanyl-D-glutamate--2,6-diaminopimelate ligase
VRGRMESVPNNLGISVLVDYAHKPDALRKVLESLREVCAGRIITVFGCGGDRDRSKRPEMGSIAEELSDISIVTSDNPRTENPLSICEEIIQGYKNKNHYFIELDRKQAIRKALEIACPGDTVLVAGKGHETYQTFVHHTISFDDRQVVQELCHEMSNPVLQ